MLHSGVGSIKATEFYHFVPGLFLTVNLGFGGGPLKSPLSLRKPLTTYD
jgi:hypothetical protein